MAEPLALRPIQTPAAWRGSELARTDEWIYQLSPDETAEIERLVVALRRAGIPRERMTRDEVRLDGLARSPTYFVRPICAERGGGLNTFFIPWYIRRAQELPGVRPLAAEQQAAIEMVESTANDPSLYLDMEFQPGDIQFLKNSVILHKRAAYEDWEEPDRKRHLLRLWLAAPDFDDGDAQLRGGITLR